MTREEYLKKLFETYSLVSVLSEKNGYRVLRVRNKALNKDMVVRSFPNPVHAYETLCGIKCENLPTVYDVLELSDGQIVLEEYIDGITVSDVMQSGKYTYRGATAILRAVSNALSALHSKGIVHRDIKPQNIIIDKNARVVLIDMNASREVSDAAKDTVIMGTVGYASPEQLGIMQSDARTDIYACGILLNVMLTGKHPSEALASGRAARIVRRCTMVNPNERYQSARQLAKKL